MTRGDGFEVELNVPGIRDRNFSSEIPASPSENVHRVFRLRNNIHHPKSFEERVVHIDAVQNDGFRMGVCDRYRHYHLIAHTGVIGKRHSAG